MERARLSGWLLLILIVQGTSRTSAESVTLSGTITDENEVPVAGVEIQAKAPAGTTQTGYSDERGHYELVLAAPGDYLVTLSKPDYFRLIDQAVHAAEGNNPVDFKLSHEFEVHETIDVRSPTNQIDPQRTEQRETLDAEQILDIPVHSGHDLGSYLPSISGVVRDNSGALHVAGGRPEETEYLLDGFEISDPATGDLTSHISVDSLREVNVESGRYGSEYAHGGSAVMQFNTYVGDDRWRFRTTNFFPGVSMQQGFHLGNWYPRFGFSGPIVPGRAWFSESLSLQHTFSVVRELPRDANTEQQWSGDNLLRVQVNLTPANILQGSFLYNVVSDSHLGLGPFSPASTTTNLHLNRNFVSLKDQFFFEKNLFEIGAAIDEAAIQNVPVGEGVYVLESGSASGRYFESVRRRNRRWQTIGNLTFSSIHWRGLHDLKAGVNMDGLGFSHLANRTPIETFGSDNVLLASTTFSGSPMFRVTNTQLGFYLQDSWQIFPKLTLQLGGRADWDSFISGTVLGPRLAANFLPFHTDATKFSVGWGIYYQPINLSIVGEALDQQRSDTFFNPDGTVASGPFITRFLLPGSGLRQPRSNTASFGWEQKITANTFAGINLLRRSQGDGLAYTNIQPSPMGGSLLLQNGRRDRYRSAEVWARHLFRGGAEVYAGYVRSEATTNQALDYSLLNPFFALQAPGPLAWDAPNRLLSWGWTPFPFWNLFLSYRAEYRTGFPFNVVNQDQQLLGTPGGQRFPGYFSLDLGIEKRFRFRGQVWAARLAIVNATNHINPEVVNTTISPYVFAGGQGRAFTARLRLVGRK